MSLPQSTDWNPARPAQIPAPTYWPATFALADVLLAWGILTTWIITAVGAVLFVISLTGWIRDILREHQKEAE